MDMRGLRIEKNTCLIFFRLSEKRRNIMSLSRFDYGILDQENATNAEKRRNRETLEILEKEFNLDYKIEEKVVPGSGIKIAESNLY